MSFTLLGNQKNYSTFGNIQAGYTPLEEEQNETGSPKKDANDPIRINRSITGWQLRAVCSKTEKRTFAAKNIKDVSTGTDAENTTLRLQGFGITTLPYAPFASTLFIMNLKELNLAKNAFCSFPECITLLTNLEGLSLADNNLTVIPASIKKLKNLSVLILSGNKIEKLPEEIGELPELETLGVSRNKLTKLPGAIGKLQKLTTLYAFENKINSLPAEIGQLHLVEFTLYKNEIEFLPKEIININELKVLDLSENNLKSLPEDIGNMTQLRHFRIYGNKDLADLPDSFENCYHITILNVEETKISRERWIHVLSTWDARKAQEEAINSQ